MKIVFITIDTPYGKKESYLLTEINYISQLSPNFYIFPIRGLGDLLKKRYASKIFPVISGHSLLFFCLKKIRRILKTIFFITSKQAVKRKLYTLYLIRKIIQLSYWVDKAGISHIHAYWASSPATVGLAVSMITNTSFSFSAHRADIESNDLLREKIEKASFVRVISNQGFKKISAINPKITNKIYVIHMGVEVKTPIVKSKKIKKIRMVCVCDLIQSKNISNLLNRLITLKTGFTLDIFGDGPLKKRLQKQANYSGIGDRVSFLGRIENNQILKKYEKNKYDILIHPSKIEGIPVAVMEAMANGIAVASTISGATGELVNDNNCYILKDDLSNIEIILSSFLKSGGRGKKINAIKKIKYSFDIQKTGEKFFKKILYAQKEN